MYKPPKFARIGTVTGGLIVSSFLLCGCEKTDPILSYPAPKHELLQSTKFLVDYERTHPKPQRMIGLVLPRETTLWFFKLQGNLEAIADREAAVRDFLKSLTFSQNDIPEWKLPPGWRELPGNDMRHATLVLEGSPELELTVSKLPSISDVPVTEQVVMNINRWRSQLSLPPIDEVDLDVQFQSEKIPVGDGTGYWINIVGHPKPKPSGMSPAPPQAAKRDGKVESGNAPALLVYDKPEIWIEGSPTQYAALSLSVSEGEQQASITVTSAGGNKLLNVNRWRGQVGLGPLTEEELISTAKKVEVGQFTGDMYEMVAGDRAIFGVIVEEQGQMWFVKMMGDAPLVERERERFVGFLKSLRLKK